MAKKPHRYVVLRRDGVLIRRLARGDIRSWNQVEFLPRALDGLRLLAANDYGVLVMASQPHIGKGLHYTDELELLTQRLLLEVALERGRIDKVYYCTHTTSENGHIRGPARELLGRALGEHGLRAAVTSFISDSIDDLTVAAAMGCPGILLRRDAFLRPRAAEDAGHEVATSLYEAAERIVRRSAAIPGGLTQGESQHFDFARPHAQR
jgi:histidinol-phosphate phosphatase family protein